MSLLDRREIPYLRAYMHYHLYRKYYKIDILVQVAIRKDGNNPWIVLEHDNSWSSSDITIKRGIVRSFLP